MTNKVIPMMSEEDQQKWAKVHLLTQGDFIYFRAGRIDGRSCTYDLKMVQDAIVMVNEMRGHPELDATKEELDTYNLWTGVKRYLQFVKYELECR